MLLPYSLITLLLSGVFSILNYNECSPEKKVCEYYLVVKEKLTMFYKKDLVYPDKGRLYKYDEHPSNYTTEVSRRFLSKLMVSRN